MHRLLERVGELYRVCLGVEYGGIAVTLDERFGDRTFGQPAHLRQHFAGRVGVQVGVVAFTECFVDSQHLEQVEYLIADVALVVAHWFLLDENATCGWVLWLSYPPVTRLNYTRR
jgi:hypothetical protein